MLGCAARARAVCLITLTNDAAAGLTAAELLLGMGDYRTPLLVPALENRNTGLAPARIQSTEQQFRGSTDWAVWLAKMNPPSAAQRFCFSGHFRQILSTLTPNGRDPARLPDAEMV